MAKGSDKQRSLRGAFFSSPLLVVCGVATIVVFMISLAGYVRRGGFWSPEVEARVYDQRIRSGGMRDGDVSGDRRVFAFQGEVYGDAERLREASALGICATLLAAQGGLERRPFRSVEALLSAMSEGGLLPPGMSLDRGKSYVSSPHGVHYVRYRVEPLGVEVISVGQGAAGGPPLLVRLPDDRFSQDALTYYVAPRAAGTEMPAPFASAAEIIRAGWRPETFRAAPPSTSQGEGGGAGAGSRAAGLTR